MCCRIMIASFMYNCQGSLTSERFGFHVGQLALMIQSLLTSDGHVSNDRACEIDKGLQRQCDWYT